MMKRTLAVCLALSLSTFATARVRRPRGNRIFAASSQSVLLENQTADAMGTLRYFTQAQVDKDVQAGILVPLRTTVSPRLPRERRYALPNTVSFIESLDLGFYRTFHQHLVVDSAVRSATTQRGLHLRNAAPAYGSRASSHERGTTVDIAKSSTTGSMQRWLITRLLYSRALGQVLVIQERGCFHIFVGGDNDATEQFHRGIEYPQ